MNNKQRHIIPIHLPWCWWISVANVGRESNRLTNHPIILFVLQNMVYWYYIIILSNIKKEWYHGKLSLSAASLDLVSFRVMLKKT